MSASNGPPAEGRTDVSGAYDRWSASYDADRNATRDLDAVVLRTHGPDPAGLHVVEAGCGTGKNTEWIAPRARSVVALDLSEGMLARARERVAAAHVRFARHDLRDAWPVEDRSVDLVLIDLVLEHVEDLAPVYAHAARALRPGGSLFVCELHPFRQLRGGQARFAGEGGEEELVPAFVHDVSEHVGAGLAAGLVLSALREWRDDAADRLSFPRLLSLTFRR